MSGRESINLEFDSYAIIPSDSDDDEDYAPPSFENETQQQMEKDVIAKRTRGKVVSDIN
jgi:hypothetical protein